MKRSPGCLFTSSDKAAEAAIRKQIKQLADQQFNYYCLPVAFFYTPVMYPYFAGELAGLRERTRAIPLPLLL